MEPHVKKVGNLYIPYDSRGRQIHKGVHDGELAYLMAEESTGKPESYKMAEIICLETGVKFPNVKKAAEWVGRSRSLVSTAIQQGIPANGYHFDYVEARR